MMAGAARGWAILRAASGVAIASLLVYWFLQPIALPLKALAFLLVSVSLISPAAGLLAFAGLAPLSTVVANWCGAPGMGVPLLEVMALGAGAGALLRGQRPAGGTRIGAPALFVAVVALASAAAMIPAAAPLARSLGGGSLFHALPLRHTALSSPIWMPVFDALIVAECALLAWAVEQTVRRSPGLALRLVSLGLLGHAGAALLSLRAVVGAALRTGDALHALPQLLMEVRFNIQTDLNAGASALLLAGVAGFGLLRMTGARRMLTGALLVLVALGLWMTGSRIALAMAAGAAIVAVAWPTVRTGRRRALAAAIALVILGASAWMLISSTSRRSTPVPRSVELRWVLAKAGLEMFKEAPVFGIGLTRFYHASTPYAGSYLLSVGWQPFENAHNNFIQVLAEQGVVGLAALLWMLTTVLASARAPISPDSALRGALVLAVAACIGTWLTGHPLLVPEFAFVFWFYCGVLTALPPALARPRGKWLPIVLVLGVLTSVPMRAAALRNALELEHYGIGLSLWQHDDSQRYREAGRVFTLYVPANDLPTQIPVRRAPRAPDRLAVEVRLGGRLIDRIHVEGEAWQNITVVVPKGAGQFEAVDFDVRLQDSSAEATGVLLRVGKAVAR